MIIVQCMLHASIMAIGSEFIIVVVDNVTTFQGKGGAALLELSEEKQRGVSLRSIYSLPPLRAPAK